MNPLHRQRIADNWDKVRNEVNDAVTRAGRQVGDVRIVGVTKYVDAETTACLFDAGCTHLGENRPQVLWGKAESGMLNDGVQWHVIGHLQRNKVRRTLSYRPTIHSVDSLRLLKSVAEESLAKSITTKVLLEINISGDEAKTGMSRTEIEAILDNDLPEGVDVCGLMAMAGWGTDAANAQKQFAAVRACRDDLQTKTGISLNELSMGMSGDFAAAISEGATYVRIGSRLFDGVRD